MRLNLAVVYRAHRILGLIIALPLAIIILSGLILVFSDQIRDLNNAYRLPEPAMEMITVAELQRTIERNWPKARPVRLYLPKNRYYSVKVLITDEDGRYLLFLHPQTGRLIRRQNESESSVTDRLYALHRGMFLGEAGRLIFSISGLMLLILWLFGLLLYRTGTRKKSRLAHRQIGVFFGGFLVCFTLCGALLNYADSINRWLFPPPERVVDGETNPVEPERLFARVEMLYPDAAIERVYYPAAAHRPMMIRFQDGARLYINPLTLTELELIRPYGRWVDWLYPIHSGRLLGNNRYWLLPVLALILSGLAVGGILSALCAKRRTIRVCGK